MKIFVNGEKRELKAIGTNSMEWTRDLLGGYGIYKNEDGLFEMGEDDFLWWEGIVEKFNEIIELEQGLNKDQRADYEAEGFCYCDLEDEVVARLDWLLSI